MKKTKRMLVLLCTIVMLISIIPIQSRNMVQGKEREEIVKTLPWLIYPKYEYDDVIAVKDIFPQNMLDENKEKNGNYEGRVIYYVNNMAGLADYYGNILIDSSQNVNLDCRQGISAKGKLYNANGYLYGRLGGGGAYLFHWNELTQSIICSEIDFTEKTIWSNKYMTAMKSIELAREYLGTYDIPDGALKYNDTYRLVGKDGQLVSLVQFEDIKFDKSMYKNVVGEYAIVKKDGLWGYLKEDGTWLTECIYEDAYPFCDGIAAVKKDGKAGFIREDGTQAVEMLFDETRSVYNGKAWVKLDGKWGVLNVGSIAGLDVKNYNTADQMQQAAVKLLSKSGMISESGSYITFFDYDMDGKLELYHGAGGGSGNIFGHIYTYEDGEYYLKDDFDLSKSEQYYTVYKNKNKEYIFIEDVVYSNALGEECYKYKYDIQTKETKLIAYYTCSRDYISDSITMTYYNEENVEISENTYNQLLESAVEGYEKVDVNYELVYMHTTDLDVKAKVKEAWNAYSIAGQIGDSNMDGKVTSKDAVILKKYLDGNEELNINLQKMDVNADGIVDSKDAVRLLKYLAGYDVVLGK